MLIALLVEEDRFGEWSFHELLAALGQTAYQHKYSGTWEDVQEFLEVPHNSLRPLLARMFFLGYHERNIMGNILPLALRLSHRLQIRKPRDPKTDNRPVRKKVFRRGYDDKGSLRFPHKWLPREYDIPVQTFKTDRRDSVIIKEKLPSFLDHSIRTSPLGLIPNLASEEVVSNERNSNVFLTQV